MKYNFLKLLATIVATAMFTMTISSQAIAEVDKSQPIQFISHWSNTGGSHGVGKTVVDYLETQGWTNINNGQGYQSVGGCLNAINQRENADVPTFWLQANPVVEQPKDHPCYVDKIKADKFVAPFFGWTEFICRRSDLDLPPIDEATGTIKVATDLPEYFGEMEEEILRAMAPNANIIIMRYTGSPGALKAIQAKEVEYVWSTLFEERSEGALVCDYNTSNKDFRNTLSLKTAFPNLDISEGRFHSYNGSNWGWWNVDNANDELKAAFAKDVTDAFTKHQPTVIITKSRGYIPPTPSSELTNKEIEVMVGEKWSGYFNGYDQ